MSWRITNASGETEVISDEQYNRIKGKLQSTTKAEQIKPHQERQQKYGTLGSMFPYITDDYEKNGDVNSVGGAIRRGIAGVKDMASYPGRVAMGGLNYLINGDYSLGKTSEEAGDSMAKQDGFLNQSVASTEALLRDPMLIPSFALPGLKVAKEAVPAGIALAELDNLNRQEGYQGDPKVAAGIGAISGLAPFLPESVLKLIQKRVQGIDRMTTEELMALVQGTFFGSKVKPRSNYELAQVINEHPEIIDEIARNANKPYLKSASEDAVLGGVKILSDSPTPEMIGKGVIGKTEYVSRAQMSKEPTAKEKELIGQIDELKARIKQGKKEGAPEAIIEEDKATLAELQQDLKEESKNRVKAYSEGAPQFRWKKGGQQTDTDARTQKFFEDLHMLNDEANTAIGSNWEVAGGRIRRNWKGEAIPETPEQVGKWVEDEMNVLADKVHNKARNKNLGKGEDDPVITNKDISVMLEKMAKHNMFEHMEALLKACTWLDESTKNELMRNAVSHKAYVNALEVMDKNVNYNYPKPLDLTKKLKEKASRNAVLGGFFEKESGFPSDFSRRYSAMSDRTGVRGIPIENRNVRVAPFVIPGLNIVEDKK